jgi:prevent-host-death family protein
MSHQKTTWTLAEAKTQFSELIDRVLTSGPQTITRQGNPAVVVVSVQEWRRKIRRKGNLAEFFAHSPLRGVALDVERIQDPLHGIRVG